MVKAKGKKQVKASGGDLNIITRELKSLTEKQDLHFRVVTDQLSRISEDVREIKQTLSSLVRMVALQEREIEELKDRLQRVEKKVGLNH